MALLGLAAPAHARRLTVWGPETFTRTTGAPVTVTRTSTIAAFDPARQYYLRIYNGPAPRTAVTSATVTMNGVTVFGPSDFNTQVVHLQKLIALTSANTVMTVRIAGASGSGFSVRVVRGLRDDGDNNNDADDDTGVPVPPPTITASIAPPPNLAGWNNGPVAVTFNCTAPESTVASCTSPITVSTEGANQDVTGTVTNADGQTAFFQVKLNIDRTPPNISPVLTPPPNAAGWNRTDVSAAFFCIDALSGVASCSPSTLVTSEGAHQAVSGGATDLAGNVAIATVAISIDKTPPTIAPSLNPPANAAGWNNTNANATFSCSDALSGVQTCEPPKSLNTEGAGQAISGSATDLAGNVASTTLTANIDKTPPTIGVLASPPANANGWNNTEVAISATCADAFSGLPDGACTVPQLVSTEGANQSVLVSVSDLAGNTSSQTVSLNIDLTPPVLTPQVSPAPNAAGWNNSDPTVTFAATDALSGIDPSGGSAPQTVTTQGPAQLVTGVAIDRAGNVGSAFTTVSLDKTSPTLAITEPASDGAVHRLPNLTIKGSALDDNLVNVVVNGSDLGFATSFEQVLPLAEGGNSFVVTANDIAGNATTRTVTSSFVRPPTVRITSPTDLAAVGTTPITFTGTVSDPAAMVSVGILRIPATVSGNSWTASVPLSEGGNVVTAVATDAHGNAGTDSITIALDTQSPRVIIDSPAAGSVVTTPTITVTGRVNDSVLGTINAAQATVRVNGIPATVSNRTFRVAGVALQPGSNSLVATALDATGNQDSKTVTITYDNLPGMRLEALSGDQTGTINEPLANPLAVRVVSASGAPLPNRDVIFRVSSNSGSLLPATAGDAPGTPKRAILVKTDSSGEARALLTLGSRAGEGNNRIEVSSPGAAGGHTFLISGHPKAPALVSVDEGSLQRGVPGQPLPRPFVVVVTDEGHNRLAGVSVKFKVEEGGGDFEGSTQKIATTDADGRALAILTLGPGAGTENNTVSASVDQLVGLPAVFTATALEPGEAANTRISGVVLDNENEPIEGVTLRIRNTAIAAQSNAQGQFTVTGAPVGDVHLQVDGSTAQRPGTYPNLEFELQTVSGAENTVGMPIYLLPLNLNQSVFVDETHGGTITIPAVPGFKLEVAPNSALFPDGSRRGTVSVTVVHADKVPMVPNVGQQPRLIVTIQPPGVRFDPPAPMSLPNVDGLPAGEVVELYSFDHDAGRFVTTGTAATSEDGSTLTSEAGTGVLKGGWFSFGSSLPFGVLATCPECQECFGVGCLIDFAKANKPCGADPLCFRCKDGTCKPAEFGLLSTPPATLLPAPPPNEGAWQTNFPFLGKTTHAGDATPPVRVSARFDPSKPDTGDPTKIEWKINTTRGAATSFSPASKAGASIDFQLEPYTASDREMVYVPGAQGNGSYVRSTSLLFTFEARFCTATVRGLVQQDQRDTMRQEYQNHLGLGNGQCRLLRVPVRTEFHAPAPTSHYLASDVLRPPNSRVMAYDLIVGEPIVLAESVRLKLNERIRGELKAILASDPARLVTAPITPEKVAVVAGLIDDNDQHLTLNSAYRNPERNEVVGSICVGSKHQFGDAIDLKFAKGTLIALDKVFSPNELWVFLAESGIAVTGDAICEKSAGPLDCATDPGIDHVHVEK